MDDEISAADALEQSKANRRKTNELVLQAAQNTAVMADLVRENHWAEKLRNDWARSAAIAS